MTEYFVAFLHKYAAPFLAGGSMAGAAVASEVPTMFALFAIACVFAYASFPAGGRAMRRLAGV